METIWRNIKGYEGYYQVSNSKEVKSLDRVERGKNKYSTFARKRKGRYLTQYINEFGYPFVVLSKNGKKRTFFVHTLVADAFPEICGERFEGAEVNHRNEVKTDNRPENLEFMPHKENINYGTWKERRSKSLEKPILQYSKKGEFLKEWRSMNQIKDELGYENSVSKCCRGVKYYKTAYGYIWKYKE